MVLFKINLQIILCVAKLFCYILSDFLLNTVKIFLGDNMECNLIEMGNRISIRRKNFKISQNALAEIVGISNNHMSNIECGREKPSLDVLIAICNALKITPDYLLLGAMHPNGVPQNLIDSLVLCTEDDIELLNSIVHHMVQRQENKWNNDNFI